MSTPTPVVLEDLIDSVSLINTFNDGIETQLVSPRTLGTQRITVAVVDDPLSPRLSEGTADTDVLNSLVDSTADFVTDGVAVGDYAVNSETGLSAAITAVTNLTTLVLGTTDVFIDGTDAYYIVAAADRGQWTQRFANGEWKRSGSRSGNDKSVAYFLPTAAAAAVVHEVVYPIAIAGIATYPPITSAETA